MGRPIDEDDVIKIIRMLPPEDGTAPMVVQSIKQLPSAQPEPCEDAISRKDAIDALTRQAEWLQGLQLGDRYKDQHKGLLTARNLIEDLPSVTPELCEDMVSRSDVLEIIEINREAQWKKSISADVVNKSVTRSKHDAHVAFCDYLAENVKALPSAQPERKNGKWNTYYHSDIDFSHSCNQCGYSAPYQMIGGEVFQKKWNFCPNCGADMRGEQDG